MKDDPLKFLSYSQEVIDDAYNCDDSFPDLKLRQAILSEDISENTKIQTHRMTTLTRKEI